jgi:multicomponent Na+:H+ antiporter subunit F
VDGVYLATALALLITLIASLVRIIRGPTDPDRMLAAQLFGTTGVAVLLLLARVASDALIDVALVFAPLAALAAVAFVRRTRQPLAGERRSEPE